MNLGRWLTVAVIVAALATVGCGRSGGGSATSPAAPAGTPGTAGASALGGGTLTVFAASSLTDAFNEIGAAFTRAHPGLDVRYNFGGSPTLRTQIEQGARADVLAVADEANMQAAFDKHLIATAGTVFARNRLVIIAPKSNPKHISTAGDLAKPNLKLILALPDVPAGRYARDAIARIGEDPAAEAGFAEKTLANVVSEEPNVKAIVTKIQLDEGDAGVVYATDVTAGVATDLITIPIADAYNVSASYPIAVTTGASRPDGAQAFIDFVLADEGQSILRKYGFLPPL